ncbi:MAG: YggS family pyridoxal phosphate-dependent enzyme [Planctomycetes bacterium]|nr:YggS family pyridoxal phosphate-dependent enzyme [Planctomycetota bacterium]
MDGFPPPIDPARLRANLESVRARVEAACRRAGRDASSVALVAVTKNRPPADVESLQALGAADAGENRVQEALDKIPRVRVPLRWHLVGHLQKNKARKALDAFSWIHSADSLDLWSAIDRILGEREGAPAAPYPAFVQVNVAGESSKSGLAPGEVLPFLEACRAFPRVRAQGLMTMAPYDEDPGAARPFFARLAALAREAAGRGLLPDPPGLSMGMSGDFEAAVEEGATHLRIGSALFL